MQITLAIVEEAIRTRGDFPSGRKFTAAFVQREIRPAWTALHRLVEDVHQGFFDKEAETSTVADQAYVAFTGTLADVRVVKGVDLLVDGEWKALRKITPGSRNRFGRTADEPEAYRLTERGIDLFPTPNAVYTLRVTYARKVIPLGLTPVEVDEEWLDFVVWKAIIALAATQQRQTGEYQMELQKATDAIRGGAASRDQQEPEYLILREYPPDAGWNGY